jgi:hypothetical protein
MFDCHQHTVLKPRTEHRGGALGSALRGNLLVKKAHFASWIDSVTRRGRYNVAWSLPPEEPRTDQCPDRRR